MRNSTTRPERLPPVIGVTCGTNKNGDIYLREAYFAAIRAAGGIPAAISVIESAKLPRLASFCQGFILSGGGDILPGRYGADVHDRSLFRETSPERDDFEIGLTRLAFELNKPVLAICRGIQVMNVALGGTLIPDIPGHIQKTSKSSASHSVTISSGSILRSLTGKGVIQTNSFHHQAVGKTAPELIVSGKADDGTIESLEAAEKRFIIGVQWHPEHMTDRSEQSALFRGLIKAASVS